MTKENQVQIEKGARRGQNTFGTSVHSPAVLPHVSMTTLDTTVITDLLPVILLLAIVGMTFTVRQPEIW